MRFFLMLGIEIIPFVNMIPANTIFVLMAHYKETKIAKLFNEALEILHESAIGGTITRASVMSSWRERIAIKNEQEEEATAT